MLLPGGHLGRRSDAEIWPIWRAHAAVVRHTFANLAMLQDENVPTIVQLAMRLGLSYTWLSGPVLMLTLSDLERTSNGMV